MRESVSLLGISEKDDEGRLGKIFRKRSEERENKQKENQKKRTEDKKI